MELEGGRVSMPPPLDFPRFIIVGVDQMLKPIKVLPLPPRFLYLPPALIHTFKSIENSQSFKEGAL